VGKIRPHEALVAAAAHAKIKYVDETGWRLGGRSRWLFVSADREQVVFPAGKPGTLVCLQTEELFRDDPVVITALTAETFSAEPVGTRRGNLWAVRSESQPAAGTD